MWCWNQNKNLWLGEVKKQKKDPSNTAAKDTQIPGRIQISHELFNKKPKSCITHGQMGTQGKCRKHKLRASVFYVS